MKYSLLSIGVPSVYHKANPYRMTADQRLDSFPSLANVKALPIWMALIGNGQSRPATAWDDALQKFSAQAQARGLTPFILDTSRRNADEEARSFLAIWRKRVRNYLDPLELVTLPIFRTSRVYTRSAYSWRLRSQARIIRRIDGTGIGTTLQKLHRWTRTHCPEYRGSQSWHRWILWGVVRVGWSTSGTDSWLWYEIRCPHLPGTAYDKNRLDDAAFDTHLDKIWLPLVRNLRWWSSSNPRLWTF